MMADYDQIMTALRNAHAAGDTAAAKRLAAMAKAANGGAGDQAMRDRIAAAKAGTLQMSPERVAEQAAIDQPVEDRMVLDAMGPKLSRALTVSRGLPFIGEYVDEAIGSAVGGNTTEQIRIAQDAFARQNPKESTALQIGGGVLGSLPAAALAVGSSVGTGLTLGQKMLAGFGAGATAGVTEGAVSGYGAGNNGDRMKSAVDRGLVGGALGGIVGAAAPAVASGAAALFQRLKGTDIKAIARDLGISDDAARVVKTALQNDDFDAARSAIDRAGAGAMLADAGPSSQNLLDASIATGGRAGRIAGDAVDARASAAGRQMQTALDDTLGAAQGVKGLAGDIRTTSAPARSAAYDAAYAAPIDYASDAGRTLEGLLKRAPAAAIKRANELMRIEGVESAQILADIADNGTVTFKRLPDVRQIDYITRAMNDVADAANGQGKLGGTTDLGRAYANLSRAVRGTLRGAVPEYGAALDTAADAISQRKALDVGYELLRPSTRRETVVDTLKGASQSEIAAAKQGIRSYIDDTLANVRASISSPDLDIGEFRRMTGELRSRAARAKMTTVLGQEEANALYATLDESLTALELRASIATNSKTAQRQAIASTVKDVTALGPVGTLMAGEPVNATKRVVQLFTGKTSEMAALRQQGIMDEIASVLTRTRGHDAKSALVLVQKALDGQPITEAQARLIARSLGTAVAVGGYQAGVQSLPKP